MDNSLENCLYKSIVGEAYDDISQLVKQGANPNKTTSNGKTCLGEAANKGNIAILKLLIDTSNQHKFGCSSITKRYVKSHKRKLKHDSKSVETFIKLNILTDRTCFGGTSEGTNSPKHGLDKSVKNQGYFVYSHSEGSSSDDSKVPTLRSPLSPTTLTPSPQGDLEWDEDIGSVAPTTSEDETWSSMYRWYAAILECTGSALASATAVSSGIDQQDAFTRTALHYAAEQGHVGAAKLLIEAGCKVDIAAGDGLTPLHIAVIRNNGEIVNMLLAAGAHVNNKTHEKMTPLHFAASRGFTDLVTLLVRNGANMEARDTNERTPLYLAAGRGHCDVVKYLITAGANVNAEEIHGYTPLCEAVWQSCTPVVEILMLSGARITHSHKLLHNAILQRQDEIVKMLALGGGINLHSDNGDTPLLLAARLSQPKICQILLQKGANVNSCNSITGASALHIAVEHVEDADLFEELLICLLEYKIDMNATTLTGDTALNRALLIHKDNAAKLLIRYGVDVNVCDLLSCGLDNLAIVSKRRSPALASMLLQAGHFMPTPNSLSLTLNSGTTAQWLYHASRQPLSLSDLCRIKIRRMNGENILFKYISSLPLPKSLIRYLMLEYEG